MIREKVEEGFVTCHNESCRHKEHCVRWLGRVYEDPQPLVYKYVSMANPAIGGDCCPMFINDQKEHMALGFTRLLAQMPRAYGDDLMAWMKSECNRTYAYEYRNGTRPIPQRLQQRIIDCCRQLGWELPIEFDDYTDEYELRMKS